MSSQFDDIRTDSVLAGNQHTDVNNIKSNLVEQDELKNTVTNDVIPTIVYKQQNPKLSICDKENLLKLSSENSKPFFKNNQYSDSSSDGGSFTKGNEGCQRKHHIENNHVKRRRKRKRPSDPKDRAMKQKALDIDRALRRSREHSSESLPSEDSAEKESNTNKQLKNTPRKTLRELAISEHGLINDDHRRRAWPQLVGVNMLTETCILPTQEEVEAHKSYRQVVLDVDRSLKRFPPGIADEERPELQDQLTRLIVRVLMKHPSLNYYQGYHDVAITFLLVVGEELGFQIVERLSAGKQLREFMTPTMERTTYLLNFMYPVIRKECLALHDYLENSEVGTIFALPWLITWFSHVLPDYKDVVRLFDFFLAHIQSPMMPVYLATAIVLHRQNEILMSGPENCDMAYVHSLLSRIPISGTFPIEKLLVSAKYLYEKYPPSSVEKDVKARMKKLDDELKMAQEKREKIKKILNEKARQGKDIKLPSDNGGGFGKFIAISGKFIVIAAPIIVGVVVYRYLYQVKGSFPM